MRIAGSNPAALTFFLAIKIESVKLSYMTNSPRIEAAKEFARIAHAKQFRRDGARPYFVHLEDTARRVAAVTDDEDMIMAAVLHDISEDQGVTVEELTEFFGVRVAGLVDELTDQFEKAKYPDWNRKERKRRERERYGAISDDAALIKLCDIAENLKDRDIDDKRFIIMFTKEKELCLPFLRRENDSRNASAYEVAMEELEKAKKELDIK